jgi:hypothetical protein
MTCQSQQTKAFSFRLIFFKRVYWALAVWVVILFPFLAVLRHFLALFDLSILPFLKLGLLRFN